MKPKNLPKGTKLYPHEHVLTLKSYKLARAASENDHDCPGKYRISSYPWDSVEETEFDCLLESAKNLRIRIRNGGAGDHYEKQLETLKTVARKHGYDVS